MSSKRRGNLLTAFNLIPVVEQVLPDRQVECICLYEKNLYVGTNDGLILYYGLVEGMTPLQKKVYQSKLKGRRQLDSDKRKSVQQLTVLPAMNRLLALLDGSLHVLDMYRLDIIDIRDSRLPKMACYCVNENKSAILATGCEVVIAPQRRKLINIYTFNGDKFMFTRDVNLAELPMSMARDGNNICIATNTAHFDAGRYLLVNLDNGGSIDLPPYPIGVSPFVRRTNKDEFLINTGDIGIIVCKEGTSNRPPLDWSFCQPFAAVYFFPYIVAWSKETNALHIFSLLDQQCVQETQFSNCKFIGQYQGKLYAATSTSIYLIAPVPLKEQVNSLLEQQKVEPAILLAETIAAVDEVKDPDKAYEYLCTVKLKAAFIFFTQAQFSKAETLFLEGNADPREIIFKFHDIIPKFSNFKPEIDLPSAEQLAAAGQFNLREAKKFLIRYLKEVRSLPASTGRREEIDTVLIKLLAEDHSPSLIPYLTNHEVYLNFDETKWALDQHKCYFALGILHKNCSKTDAALRIWRKICDGEYPDKEFPGYSYIVTFLKELDNVDMVMKHASWILSKSEKEGVTIFTDRPQTDTLHEKLRIPAVLEVLEPFEEATMLYLEYVIDNRGSEDETIHTKLGNKYLTEVLDLKSQGNLGERYVQARQRLTKFLKSSLYYRPSVYLNRVQDTDLFEECAILYGKMDEHEKALKLLAHQLEDYEGAEEYCATYSKNRSREERQTIYQTLLAVYLKPPDSSKPFVIKPILQLLNTHGGQFDAAKVLQLLPPQWEIGSVREFLVRSLRSSAHTARSVKIEHGLAKGEYLQTRHDKIQHEGGPVVMNETKTCPVCQLPFNDATAFVRYPNGIITHLRCGRNKNICPITGTWFGN